MSDYKYSIGDRVHVNTTALDQLPPKNRKRVSKTFKSNLFSIAQRRNDPTNQYFLPGYDWQGGDSWVDESFISKWAGAGPLSLRVTIDPEGDTDVEVERKLRNVCKKVIADNEDLTEMTFELLPK
ncbi:MAG: hypothetical protein DRQ39_02685 [Gammaproteobacteria bacterium]|nr:MAG: hypothetical protein DRQ39_02685 [Gammaproteobacteria bacterium]